MSDFTRILIVLAVVISGRALGEQPEPIKGQPPPSGATASARPGPGERTAGGQAVVRPAVEGIFEAFRTHALVGLGDDHGLVQEMDFYAALIRDPRFARQVGNVVFEAGASSRQDLLDRYLAGEIVPYKQLRSVWTDTVGAVPTAGNIGFLKFFAAVREVNKALAPTERIRIWLGEPPLDWSVEKPAWESARRLRDSHPAELIVRNILAKGKKALVIYGAYHFTKERYPDGGGTLYARVEETYPGAFFLVQVYAFSHRPAGCATLLQRVGRMLPALAVIPRNGALDPGLRSCATFPDPSQSPTAAASAVLFDAVLFCGPLETLTHTGTLPEYLFDAEYRREMYRRSKATGFPFIRVVPNGGPPLRKADYVADLDMPGYTELLDSMFAQYDRNKDGAVGFDEYVDPIPLDP